MNPERTDTYRAVVVPQTVGVGKTTIGITIDGYNYAYTREGGVTYTSGKLHNFTVKVSKKSPEGSYSLTLVSEEITPWEADNSSHDFEANSYLVIDVPVAGTLKNCLAKAGADYQTVRNLKITGILNEEDFRFMREDMTTLTAVNMKEVKLAEWVGWAHDDNGNWVEQTFDGVFPNSAFYGKTTLRRIVLPEDITGLGQSCLCRTTLSGTIIIPESVKIIGDHAFYETKGDFAIVLPSKLERIEEFAFSGSSVSMEIHLPNTLKYIGFRAFMDVRNAYGTFFLPAGLEYIGEECFGICGTNLEGELLIPQTITEISGSAFRDMGFKGGVVLKFHDGVTSIGTDAFSRLVFSALITFPKSLINIDSRSFVDCKFVGDLILPESISTIGENAFSNTNIKGTVKIPSGTDALGGGANLWLYGSGPFSNTNIEHLIIGDNVELINPWANINCYQLQYIEIGKNVSFIGEEAFGGCPNISTIVCLAKEPPILESSAFKDIDLAHCVVEVPEESVDAYRRAEGWSIFRSITPHHELSLSRSEFNCLNKELSRQMIIRAECPWDIAEKPEWIHIIPDHADYKEEITVKIDPLSNGAGNRESKVVFRLKESGYTNYMTVR